MVGLQIFFFFLCFLLSFYSGCLYRKYLKIFFIYVKKKKEKKKQHINCEQIKLFFLFVLLLTKKNNSTELFIYLNACKKMLWKTKTKKKEKQFFIAFPHRMWQIILVIKKHLFFSYIGTHIVYIGVIIFFFLDFYRFIINKIYLLWGH